MRARRLIEDQQFCVEGYNASTEICGKIAKVVDERARAKAEAAKLEAAKLKPSRRRWQRQRQRRSSLKKTSRKLWLRRLSKW